MESVGAFPDVEWDSIVRMLNADQGFDSLDGPNSRLQYIFQESRVSGPSSSGECYYFNDCSDTRITNNAYMTLPDTCMEESGNPCDEQLAAMAVPAKEWQLKRKFDLNTNLSENPKKKPRASGAMQKSKKTGKVTGNGKDEEESDGVQDQQSSSSCSSEDDIASQEPEMPSPLTTMSGKTRASRGSATDPQSLYARKRREKINERLKVLQNLVPNGTKVDISTMLEEAVDYVKFLQLQIKLLSSDDMWMYAPIAYNGMDLGLNGKMSPASL